MSSSALSQGESKPGSLTIAGSGIASVAHITLETVSYIKSAHTVFYIVCDPVTESFIKENNKNTFDLTVFYEKSKERYHSYVEMAEVMLQKVRAGHDVLGLFYGHPGVFVSPAHRALIVARNEGHNARMLPGISAEDYLFADLQLEPGLYGCMTSEATELLAHNRPLNPSVHNIIWQVGSVGVSTMEYEKSKFQMLVDRLEEAFGPDHKIVQYIGAVIPQSHSAMVVYTVQDLRNEQVAKQIGTSSTLYIPPRHAASIHTPTVDRLELSDLARGHLSASLMWDGPRFVNTADYGPLERQVVAQLHQNQVPENRDSLHGSPAMKDFMIKLSLEPKLRDEYNANPSAVVAKVQGLTDREKFALQLNHEGPVRVIMSRRTAQEPSEEELEEAASGDGTAHNRWYAAYAISV
ncbi:hypothetical protein FRC07_002595 [Ceratobasidium sp. 392]|nr:hypothetical protein FRC07_002595 [Ceratobasidium sp. 392]